MHQPPKLLEYWNRHENRQEKELVYGELLVQLLYQTKVGQMIADRFLSKPWLSRIYGRYQSSKLSKHKINAFISKFQIPMEEYENGPFESFNDFFIRKFRPYARIFNKDPNKMPAFAEARYFAFDSVAQDKQLPVKNIFLSPAEILRNSALAKPFENGPLLLARLCPTDYHRFHFPDDGIITESYRISGGLHSVNPIALGYKKEILVSNERHVTLLQTKNFGKLAYIEVGALCVGKIVQTHVAEDFTRGDEKGYFLFGGSTVIVIGEPGAWKPTRDLISNTQRGIETLVRLGDGVAERTEV